MMCEWFGGVTVIRRRQGGQVSSSVGGHTSSHRSAVWAKLFPAAAVPGQFLVQCPFCLAQRKHALLCICSCLSGACWCLPPLPPPPLYWPLFCERDHYLGRLFALLCHSERFTVHVTVHLLFYFCWFFMLFSAWTAWRLTTSSLFLPNHHSIGISSISNQ